MADQSNTAGRLRHALLKLEMQEYCLMMQLLDSQSGLQKPSPIQHLLVVELATVVSPSILKKKMPMLWHRSARFMNDVIARPTVQDSVPSFCRSFSPRFDWSCSLLAGPAT